MPRTWPSNRTEHQVRMAKRKRAAKAFAALDLTPYISKILAGICCTLAESPHCDRIAFTNTISRIVNGGRK